MNRSIAAPLFALLLAGTVPAGTAVAEESREVVEAEIDAPVADVWRAFTTTDGLKSWVAPIADIDFRVGGKWRSNYNAKGQLGDETTIENTILAYDPERMPAIKATKFPRGFPFAEVATKNWSVFYFESLSNDRTKLTVVGLGYTDDPRSQQMRGYFETANRGLLEKLEKVLVKSRESKEE